MKSAEVPGNSMHFLKVERYSLLSDAVEPQLLLREALVMSLCSGTAVLNAQYE
jgi:hypothetical protein